MPPLRPHLRRSEHLQHSKNDISRHIWIQKNVNMSVRGRGRGRGSTKDETTTNFRIVWETATNAGRTSKMVKWLVDHPVDCIVLFSEDKSTPCPEGRASGRTKLEICAVIASLVFKDDEDFAPLFVLHAAKFAKAVQDRLGTLKKGYREQAVKFKQTGNGIAPDSEGHSNLLQAVKKEFPWYSDLHSLWGGISSYTPKAVITSTPGASRGTQLLALVQKKDSSNAAASCDPSVVDHPAATTPDVQATTAPSPTPSDPSAVPQAVTGDLASPAARLPPVGHQDKGKERRTDPPSEDETPEPPQDVDMDEDNFGGPDYPGEGDTDMDLRYARGHKRSVSARSPSPPSFTPFIYPNKSLTPDMDNRSAFRSGSPASQTSSASRGRQAHRGPSSYRSSSVMSSASSRAIFSSTSNSPGTSQNTSSKRSKTLAPPSRDTIHNLLDKGMAAIDDGKARSSHVKLKSLRLKYDHARHAEDRSFQRELHNSELANAAIAHQREQERVEAQIRLKQAEADIFE
ncbi:hypothetical protein BU15DRAFT_79468 [Melanogaster broomeanus]|nr:hypothetical protein BU15DRAFT_79468 [Melanogaster broomeanus]